MVVVESGDAGMSRHSFPEGKGAESKIVVGVCMREDMSGQRFLTFVHCRDYLQGMQAGRADCRGAGLVEVRTLKPSI